MPELTHYLVTRYNIAIQGWEKDRAGQDTQHKTWLDHRMDLFSRYCVPTVQNQNEKNFIWLIYFNKNTPRKYIQEIEKKLIGLNYNLRFVSNFQECLADLKNIISSSPTPFAITSRLDNDDGIGKSFIRDVQHAFAEEHGTLIIPQAGVVYDLNRKIMTRIPKHKKNHYGSLIEQCRPVENLTTILGFAHDKAHSFKTVILDQPNSWIKIIHDRNLKSQLYGMPAHPKPILSFYNIDAKFLSVSAFNSIGYILSRGIRKVLTKILGNRS